MSETGDSAPLPPEQARAEELLDQAGQTVGQWVARLSAEVVRGVALAREEAEDIVAEAQNIRRGQQP